MIKNKNHRRVFDPASIERKNHRTIFVLFQNKKGKGHVEAIISFVIFIGFLGFLFSIFNPFSTPENTGIVEGIFLNMEEELSVELRSISVVVAVESNQGCFSIDYVPQLNCKEEDRKLLVKDFRGVIVGAEIVGDKVEIENTGGLTGEDFYTISCAPGINDKPLNEGNCQVLQEVEGDTNPGKYLLGILVKKNLWFEPNFEDFETRYGNDYEGLRNKLVPQGSDFGFSVWNLNDLGGDPLFHGESSLSRGRAVDAKTVGISVLDANANIIKRTINIRVY